MAEDKQLWPRHGFKAAQDGAYIKMTPTEYLILRFTAIKDNPKI